MPSLRHLRSLGTSLMQTLPVRLVPGDDLRAALETIARDQGIGAAFVMQGIGSLSVANLRYAGLDQPTRLDGDLEILTLAGSLSADGAHLHMAVSNAEGRVVGGHVSPGCIVRTTAEILIVCLDGVRFSRDLDPAHRLSRTVHTPSGLTPRLAPSANTCASIRCSGYTPPARPFPAQNPPARRSRNARAGIRGCSPL